MTEDKRLIQGTYITRRYLHSDEIFRKERNWNIDLPSEREFKNGYGIITDKNDIAYSIDELVELLNEFQKENVQLKQALFFYLDIVLAESLTDFDKWCNLLFNCNYEEAKRKYGDFEYKEWWESE